MAFNNYGKMNIEEITQDFIKVCALADVNLIKEQIEVEVLSAGCHHIPTRLPKNKIAVYIFNNSENNLCYKVGKVGRKSNARYQTHHYSPNSSKSNLAKSILDDYEINENMDIQNDVSGWIKQNTTRINILIDADIGILVLNLLEAFVQNKLKPKYEGFKSQR